MNPHRATSPRALERSALRLEALEPRVLLSVTLEAGGETSYPFADTSGDAVKVGFQGDGTAVVHFADDVGNAGDITGITVTGSTTDSSLSVKAKPGTTSVGPITVTGDLKALKAKGVELKGNVTVTGTVLQFEIGDTNGNRKVDIQGPGITKVAVGNAEDLEFTTAGGISTLKGVAWGDGDGTPKLTADWLGTMKIAGNRKAGIAGDFDADLTLNGADAPKGVTLKSAKIAGEVGCTWGLTGNAGTLKIGGGVTGWTAAFHGDLKTFSVSGAIGLSDVTVDGNLKSAKLPANFGLIVPPGGQDMKLDVGGTAKVKGLSETLAFTNAIVYTTDGAPYTPASLLLLPPGTTVTGDTEFESGSRSGAGIPVDFTFLPGTVNVNGHACTVLRMDPNDAFFPFLGSNLETFWWTDGEGTHLERIAVTDDGSGIGQVCDLNGLLVFPADIGVGGTHTAETTVPTQFLDFSYGPVGGWGDTGEGTVRVTGTFEGHEDVVTPSGTYLAAKISGTAAVDLELDLWRGPSPVEMAIGLDLRVVPGAGPAKATVDFTWAGHFDNLHKFSASGTQYFTPTV